MAESTLLPYTLGVSLKIVDYSDQLLPLIVGIQKKLSVTQRTAKHTSLIIRHWEYRRLSPLDSWPNKTHPLISIENHSYPHFILELMTLKNTLQTVKDIRKYTQLQYRHTYLHRHNHLHYISPLFVIKFISYFKIYYALSCDLGTLQIGLIYIFINLETKSAHVTSSWSASTIELEIGIYVSLASYAS
jgi:hypothetical protein